MLDNFLQLSDIHLFILLSLGFTFFSLIAIAIIRRYVPIKVQYKDNSVIGDIAALIGVIYGVLVGLTALYLFNNNSYAADAVQREANAVADIYRDSTWLKEPIRARIQTHLKSYIVQVVDVEWPAMKAGKIITNESSLLINEIENQLHAYNMLNSSESLILQEMLEEVKSLYDAREQRVHMSYSQLNPAIWLVIFIGTILTIGINFLFGMNFYFHMITVTAVSLMASAMIFLLLTLEHPFQGEFVIEPAALRSVASLIHQKINSPAKTPYKNYEF